MWSRTGSFEVQTQEWSDVCKRPNWNFLESVVPMLVYRWYQSESLSSQDPEWGRETRVMSSAQGQVGEHRGFLTFKSPHVTGDLVAVTC